MSQYILPLADPRAKLETVGGKGASLARLASAGLPVPDGFHITIETYWRFVRDNTLRPAILAAVDAANPAAADSLEAASRQIQERFAGATMSADVAEAIATAY